MLWKVWNDRPIGRMMCVMRWVSIPNEAHSWSKFSVRKFKYLKINSTVSVLTMLKMKKTFFFRDWSA